MEDYEWSGDEVDMIVAVKEEPMGLDDYEDTTDYDMDRGSAHTFIDHLGATLQEIEELPSPTFDFVSKQTMYIAEVFSPDDKSQPGPVLPHVDTERTELDYFSLFYTPDLLQRICDFTNAHAAAEEPSSYGTWKAILPEELQAFYAIRTFIELFCKATQDSLWQDHSSTQDNFFLLEMPGISHVFTRKRYKHITKYLHYCAVDDAPHADDLMRDRAYKIRMIVDHLGERFSHYYKCGEKVSVDEFEIPFRGSECVKGKPWAVKLWKLCDSISGYCYSMNLYSGRDVDFKDSGNVDVTSAVVLKLCKDISGSQRIVYTDKRYTSPSLCHYLQQRGLHSCGAAMTNRAGFPKEIIAKPKDYNQGEFQWQQCQNTAIVATSWCDSKPLYFLSTRFVPEYDGCTIPRHDSRGDEVAVPATPVVVEYNKMMGGVKVSDKMAKLDKSRKSYRWYSRIDRKMVLLSMVNAHVLYKESTGKLADQRTFILRVIHQLLGTAKFRHRLKSTVQTAVHAARNDARLVDTSHFPVKGEGKNHRCVVCVQKHNRYRDAAGNKVNYQTNPFKLCKSTFMCRACNVYLCTSTPCFTDYHSKEKFWE